MPLLNPFLHIIYISTYNFMVVMLVIFSCLIDCWFFGFQCSNKSKTCSDKMHFFRFPCWKNHHNGFKNRLYYINRKIVSSVKRRDWKFLRKFKSWKKLGKKLKIGRVNILWNNKLYYSNIKYQLPYLLTIIILGFEQSKESVGLIMMYIFCLCTLF